jgi:hypothetical protein
MHRRDIHAEELLAGSPSGRGRRRAGALGFRPLDLAAVEEGHVVLSSRRFAWGSGA